jgi:hypothetical protein
MIKFFLLGVLLLSACAPIATTSPTMILTKSPTLTPTITETSTPIPTITLTPVPTLESITGGWSTFHTPEYGFSFQYPAVYDKGFYDPIDPLAFCNVQTSLKNSEFNIWIGHDRITVEETSKNLQEYVNDQIKMRFDDSWQITLEQTIADNLPGIKLGYAATNGSRWGITSFFIHNSHALAIDYYERSFLGCDPIEGNHSAYWVYEQIINTLKFDK